MRVVASLLLLVAIPIAAQQARPLPNQEAFVREVRARLQPDDDRQREFAYVETRRQVKLDSQGRAQDESVKVFESSPGFPGEPRWERLIAEDGKPVPKATLDKQDRERQRDADTWMRKRARETASDREHAARDREKRRREQTEMIDEAFRVFDFRMDAREAIEGHDTIRFSMAPRPKVATHTRIGGMLRHFQGRAWISESDYELVKLDVEAIDDLSFGLGLLARIHQGSHLTFERRKISGVWLPSKAVYTASARLLLLKRMRVSGVSEYSNYRRFTVESSEQYAPVEK